LRHEYAKLNDPEETVNGKRVKIEESDEAYFLRDSHIRVKRKLYQWITRVGMYSRIQPRSSRQHSDERVLASDIVNFFVNEALQS
jgi:hypothetical protein